MKDNVLIAVIAVFVLIMYAFIFGSGNKNDVPEEMASVALNNTSEAENNEANTENITTNEKIDVPSNGKEIINTEDTDKVDNKSNSINIIDTVSTEYSGKKLADKYINFLATKKFYISMDRYEDGIKTGSIVAAMDKDKYVAINIDGEKSTRIINISGVLYSCNDNDKKYIKSDEKVEVTIPIGFFNNPIFIAEGTEKYNGEELKYEEYRRNEGTISENIVNRYYFKDDKVVGITSNFDNKITDNRIIEISDKIPEGIFDIPSGYVEGL
jgi:hypothetical protein